MKNFFYLLGVLSFFVSCNKYPTEIERALIMAEENRTELEKVLDYCKKKSKIAYESACFLITNMQYHESEIECVIDSLLYHRYFVKTDSICRLIFDEMSSNEFDSKKYDSLRLSMAKAFELLPPVQVYPKQKVKDLQSIKADYLIDNIESALCIWDEKGYSYKKDFDFFKEFILPYRSTNEYPQHSRSTVRDMFSYILSDTIDTSINNKLEHYKSYIEKCRWINKHINPQKHLGIYDLIIPKFKMDCHNMTTWSNNILRSCGIPTAYEFTPKWMDRDSRHFWCVSPDSVGILQPYTAPDNNIREDWDSDIKFASKVYRRTFGAQRETPYFIADSTEYIPETFRSPLLLDQTFRYHQTITLRIPLEQPFDNKLVYLCMFNPVSELTPVGWGKVDQLRNEMVFEQVPINILFFPVYYDNETMVNAAEPFIIHSSDMVSDIPLPLTENKASKKNRHVSLVGQELFLTKDMRKKLSDLQYITLSCDTINKTNLHVLRKYPEKRRMRGFHEKLEGAYFLGSNYENSEFDTLFVLDHIPFPYLQEVSFQNTGKYRFYRFCTTDKAPVNIAHMEFLGPYSQKHDCVAPTLLPVFSKGDKNVVHDPSLFRVDGIPLRTGSRPEHAFDNDYNTHVGSSSIGMDFNTPVQITNIRFIPRNANNMIVPGNSYLLLYYDNGWKEHKILYAEHNYLDFQNVPSGTIYWLRNLTEGKEELPFFYIDNKQYFLHIDTLSKNDI